MDLEKRTLIYARCKKDLKYRQQVLELCRRDLGLWVNVFGVTYDPRRNDPQIAFLLFPKQEELLNFFANNYQEKRRALLQKSRDVGATWLIAAFLVHGWLFSPGFKGAVGSRKAELVDKQGDPDCIFEKIRTLIRNLPEWMIPKGWDRLSRSFLIRNPLNGSTITGEGGDNMGRGGRSGVYFVDESAFIERSKKVIAALSQNTDCLIQVSTPNGTTNEFYRAVFSGKYPVFSIHWKDDPRRNQWVAPNGQTGNGWAAPADAIYPWYERQVNDLDPVTVAQELDLDYTASVAGIYIPAKWVRSCIDAHLRLSIQAEERVNAGLDVATEGSNKSVLIIRRGGVVADPQHWQGVDTTQTAYRVNQAMVDNNYNSLCFDADGVGAGVAGTLAAIQSKPYLVTVFHGAGTPSEHCYWEGEQKTSKQKFRNKRAEAWGIVRERIKKTYEMIEGIREHPLGDLISLPNHGELITQLSQPVVKYDASGKILLESKQDLQKRGLSSPDFADALALAFYPGADLDWLNNL